MKREDNARPTALVQNKFHNISWSLHSTAISKTASKSDIEIRTPQKNERKRNDKIGTKSR